VLVKSVLSSMPIHFLTVYKLSKWAEKDIGRLRHIFLWWGRILKELKEGIAWSNGGFVLGPRIREGRGVIGIKDLERFGRALRLRWLWNCWDVVDCPRKNLLKIYDKRYMALFFASTVITVNNGMNTPLWEVRRLNGVSPKDLAPNLFKQAKVKYRTI
jgi:hypothetical protein